MSATRSSVWAESMPAVERSLLSNIDIVLVGTLQSGNIGSVARAMANTGMTSLVLVRPCCTIDQQAYSMATHGARILRSARILPTLREALTDTVHAVGTTARERRWRDCFDHCELGARAVPHAMAGRVALVFGPEDAGLSNDELELCDEVTTIATAPGAASLNISQAVLLVCYELFTASCKAQSDSVSRQEPAPASMTEAMYDHMREALLAIGYLNPQNPAHTLGMIRRVLSRAGLSVPEVRMLRGIFRQLVWYVRSKGS